MAQAGNLYSVASSSTADFQGTLAQNAAAVWRVQLPAALGGRSRLRNATIISIQNLDWEVQLYRTSNGGTPYAIPPGGTIDNIQLAGRYRFFAADGTQVAATGPYTYYIDGMDIAYHDLDSANASISPSNLNSLYPFLNLVLVNRSAAGKSAGAAGALTIRLSFEATNA
jgi:hypothetical protein